MKSKQEIKKFFENGDIPNQEQFWDWQDSYWHKDENIPSNKVDIDLSQKADLVGGKVPAAQLPSYVDDVIEFNSFTALPIQGESGKIYVNTDTNKIYRWTGTIYIDITQGDVGTLQAVTERGNETTENVKIQGTYFGGLASAENIIIGDESSYVNNRAGGTIAIGKGTKPEGTDHLVIGNTALANNVSGSIGNTVVGHFAMMQSPSSSENAVFGYNTFSSSTNAFANAIFGTYAGQFSGESLVQNTIFGYNAGNGLGSNSGSNIIIGAQSAFGNVVLKNKLYIHTSSSSYTKTVSDALISGDFVDRYVNINGKFSVTPGQMPSSDSSYTKNIVAKPDGTFGWENKVEYIPLEGAPMNKPVTGDIYVKDSLNYTRLSPGFIYCSDLSDNGTIISTASVKFLEANQGTADFTKYGITTLEGEFTIACYKPNARGLSGHFDYTENIEDLDYVQKKYVDKKQSHSATEVKTGATWINGKPIYRKTVVYDTIPSNGEIDITVDFKDVEMIVSNQMFTEWYAMDVAFAGNQWRGQVFITLQPNVAKIEDIKNLGYNYSLIDSFTLTLEYTKTTD
ncbi:hypothetical protein ATE47_16095 [Chryseobacterium sp. IHB B 17019]|jgi:hypothetical protein|uniref:hypothetical protein n=1 Tax=Chryseobacterium sp. IHB B 17019 TaxID=1721091 RepID=UPI00071FC198|nr:hypothetical protein [Chryseobacterium sp. IHB B 17019]ALR31942.1 hypothetical protein ATE47_16095 [Chryseobacterium sp. IHB B 17019]